MPPRAYASSSADIERLWAVVSDVQSWPDRLPTFDQIVRVDESNGPSDPGGHDELDAGPIGRRFAVRQPGLPAAVYEITEWSPHEAFTWVSRTFGVTTTARHTLTRTESGAGLALAIEWRGPLAPLVRAVLSRKTQRLIDLEAATFARHAGAHE